MKTVLVVEDDSKIRKVITHLLRSEGYAVTEAADGREAVVKVEAQPPDLILLDIGLPNQDGFEVCRRVRGSRSIPIIIVSARSAEIDKVVGFNLGIDDYITKPFSPTEMVLRVKAVLRRSETTAPVEKAERLERGRLTVDRKSRTVTLNGLPVDLTAKEFDLVWVLASHPNRVFTRDHLLDLVWGHDHVGDAGTVTVLIRRLREKMEEDPANPQVFRTVWGVGYKFAYGGKGTGSSE
jgi:DNA-binding response OmpR family regulator